MAKFTDKVVLITGAGTGIGRAAALAFAREGASLVLGNRNERAGEETVKAARALGARAEFRRTDVTRAGDIEALVALARERFGGLHAAFNNAGVEGEFGKPFVETTEAGYDQVFDVNVKGVWRAMKAQVPAILASGGGAIVNNSSIAGLIGFPGASVYVATKHAVEGLSKSVALELATASIRVNTVCPGPVDTEMVGRLTGNKPEMLGERMPMKRVGKPDEIAHVVVWLCSSEASYVTGQSIAADGGFVAG